jgi:outer membrane protein assembly factor BamB
MKIRAADCLSNLLVVIVGLLVFDNLNASDTAGNDSADNTKLMVDWVSQLEIGGRAQVVDIHLNISYEGARYEVDGEMVPKNKTTTYFVIEYDSHMERISERDLDAFGKPFGVAGAENEANVRKQIIEAELKAQGKTEIQVQVRKVVLPDATIYVLASNGLVTAIDAETGWTKWRTVIGRRDYPSLGIGAGSDFVAAINGSSVYCLEAETGKLVWDARCTSAPSASPAVSDKFVFVPQVNGRVESFSIDRGIAIRSFGTAGKATARPLVTSETVSWATGNGYYTVAPIDRVSAVNYRLDTRDSIVSSASYQNGSIFVASSEGLVYAIDEKSGAIQWEFSAGERIKQSPVPVGDSVLIITTGRRLFRLDINTGKAVDGWASFVPDVSQFLGISAERIYVLDGSDRIKAIDQNSGDVVATTAEDPIDLVLANNQSDRLYVATRSGSIQCLRERGRELPFFHGDETMADKPAAAGDGTDPFATDEPPSDTADPFASPDEKTDEAKDPFATSDETEPTVDQKGNEGDPFSSGGAGDAGSSGDNASEAPDDDAGSEESDDPFSGGG